MVSSAASRLQPAEHRLGMRLDGLGGVQRNFPFFAAACRVQSALLASVTADPSSLPAQHRVAVGFWSDGLGSGI